MKCPFCFTIGAFVKDSRETDNGNIIRRRRYCKGCGGRFTTFERVQLGELLVIKRSGIKKAFDRNKVLKSIATAVRKRNISEETINQITNKIVLESESSSSREIPTRKIGELIMQELAKIDLVAYVRFASVYKDFSSAQDFARFVNKIKPSK
jgi:transcriptional repressor NrdR